ncbi:hypothetical protein OMP38_03035 [Cohnella ginsengisoli]|uniref:Uncharacterized protein n=1 Tax=Cohnella ginsengisoli TaxID=425004 RepID=A0A9X4QLB3_9BACL|nr:hypothetical protein [Cohnella ginsengisoli]MDG0789937.1 hypothetical protein [Cohnella ginsengisoli]
MDHEKKIEMLQFMLEEKIQEKNVLRNQMENLQGELKQVDMAITTFQGELEKLSGNKLEIQQPIIKGSEIGEAAIEALERLGGSAHYSEVKQEIEKMYTISGLNDKSRSDSVWTYLNKRDDVTKLGRGAFKLNTTASAAEKKDVCRKYGLAPVEDTHWDMGVLHQAHENLSPEDLKKFLDEMSRLSGKDWIDYYRKILTGAKKDTENINF